MSSLSYDDNEYNCVMYNYKTFMNERDGKPHSAGGPKPNQQQQYDNDYQNIIA